MFRQMSVTLTDLLLIPGLTPLDESSYQYSVIGGAIAYVVIAVCSDLVWKRSNKFLPLFFYALISLLM
jgi:hypothetical protein